MGGTHRGHGGDDDSVLRRHQCGADLREAVGTRPIAKPATVAVRPRPAARLFE
jgi:hypothetical protein